ncbi:MAG: pectinesterase family protein [Rikenellaceae bacterium]|nr:pectinesterase family protein [Rikenellaceae bacterium]
MKKNVLAWIGAGLWCWFAAGELPAFAAQTERSHFIVALDGSGDFTKIQDAIDHVPDHRLERTVIFLKNGIYDSEKLIVPKEKTNITLLREDREKTIVRYHMYDCSSETSANKCPAESWALWRGNRDLVRTSATLTVAADGFIAENLTLENTAGPVGQAQALTVTGDRGIYRNCNLNSYQDTIYLWKAGQRIYFENCLIIGRTDYIYGASIAFFEGCEIRSWGGGWITAPATPKEQPYGFVFHRCRLTYADHSPRPGDDGRFFSLGRPWHNYPKVAWIECEMSNMLDPLGWPTKWRMDYFNTSRDLHLYEYGNTGPGADMSGRAAWAGLRALTEAEAADYTVEKVLGDPEKEW